MEKRGVISQDDTPPDNEKKADDRVKTRDEIEEQLEDHPAIRLSKFAGA